MTQRQLTEYNLGQSLDDLANLDPRGYGVCRILYAAARESMGGPLAMRAAKALTNAVQPGDLVYILTGFVLPPWDRAETDGVVGAVLLARALAKALGARSMLICPEEATQAAQALVELCHLQNIKVIPFTKDASEAEALAGALLAEALPAAVVSVEAPGADAADEYHNAAGANVTPLEAKLDALFLACQQRDILSVAIGDLGNEIGMGKIAAQLQRFVPCIPAATAADHLVTATVSDWGCYALIAALAFLREDIDIMHDADLERAACETAVRNGLIDMTGQATPAIDGFGLDINASVVTLMRECVCETLTLRGTCAPWFEKVIGRGYFEGKVSL